MSKSGIKSKVFSILILPFNAVIVIPTIIIGLTYGLFSWNADFPLLIITITIGSILIITGIALLSTIIYLFHKIGRGTLAPWDPTKKLVVSGPYKYIRNPMIGGVLLILLGEAITACSIFLFAWFILFLITNILYFIFKEEPDLVKRFGKEYVEYKKNTPMFFPKIQK